MVRAAPSTRHPVLRRSVTVACNNITRRARISTKRLAAFAPEAKPGYTGSVLKLTFLARLLPPSVCGNTALYNLIVVAVCVLAAAVLLVPLVLAAMLAAFLVSDKLKAGMAGMSIILIFVSAAVFADLVFLAVLIARNILWK